MVSILVNTNKDIITSNILKVNEVAKYFKAKPLRVESPVYLLEEGPLKYEKYRIFQVAVIYRGAKLWIQLKQDGIKLKTSYYEEPEFDSALLDYLKAHDLEKVIDELSPELSRLRVIRDFRNKLKFVISNVQRYSNQGFTFMQSEGIPQKNHQESTNLSSDGKQEKFWEHQNKKLVISLIGSVNSGKSQAINALTGITSAFVKARSGSTKVVSFYSLNKNVIIADTPGLNDIHETVSQTAINFVKESADVVLFFINANAGITATDKKTFRNLQKLEKEILVIVNKIDTLDEEEYLEVRSQIYEELSVMPFCISAKKKVNLEQLHEYIERISER